MVALRLRTRRDAAVAAWSQWRDGRSVDVRPDVHDSWLRSAASVSVDIDGAPSAPDELIRDAWRDSDLRTVIDRYNEQLTRIAVDGSFVVAVTNRQSTILWTTGSRHMRARAERANFAPGGRWDEQSVGTNALDLALRTNTSQSVFSAEHFAPLVHQWVCYAAPITDPRTGQQLGVLDLSTTWDQAHPLAMSTTVALVQLLERELSTLRPREHETATLELRVLGTPAARISGADVRLSRRQFEICTVLALHPDGLSLEELHARVYGDAPVSVATLKAEMSHLRQLLGGCITSRPYRLTIPVVSDVAAVLAAIEQGTCERAMDQCGGALLPQSESPWIIEMRDWIEVALRTAALRSADVLAVTRFVERHPYDLEAAEHLARLVSASDVHYPAATARLQRARSA